MSPKGDKATVKFRFSDFGNRPKADTEKDCLEFLYLNYSNSGKTNSASSNSTSFAARFPYLKLNIR